MKLRTLSLSFWLLTQCSVRLGLFRTFRSSYPSALYSTASSSSSDSPEWLQPNLSICCARLIGTGSWTTSVTSVASTAPLPPPYLVPLECDLGLGKLPSRGPTLGQWFRHALAPMLPETDNYRVQMECKFETTKVGSKILPLTNPISRVVATLVVATEFCNFWGRGCSKDVVFFSL